MSPLFGRRRSRSTDDEQGDGPLPAPDVTGGEWLSAVGESFARTALDQVTGGGLGMFTVHAALVRQPENEHDRNAIAVVVDGLVVAHLARGDAERFAAGMDAAGGVAACTADIRRVRADHDWSVTLHVDFARLDALGLP